MSKTMTLLLTMALTLSVASATEAAVASGASGLKTDQVARRVFPVQLVLANQRQIGLTEPQRAELVREMQETQGEILPLQVEISAAGEELARLLEVNFPDEGRVLDLTAQVLDLEARIKTRHMRLLVRVKNLLTVEQQRQLREIRRRRAGARRDG